MSNDPVHSFVRVDFFLHGDLVDRARFEATADTDVQTLGVFSKHDEINVGRSAVLQRAKTRIEQAYGPIVDVEIELKASTEQDVACVAVVRHARIAERTDEDRVEGT